MTTEEVDKMRESAKWRFEIVTGTVTGIATIDKANGNSIEKTNDKTIHIILCMKHEETDERIGHFRKSFADYEEGVEYENQLRKLLDL